MSSAKYSPVQTTESYSIHINDSQSEILGNSGNFGVLDYIVLFIVYLFWIITLPVTWCCSFKIISQFERVLVFRIGRLLPLKGPGFIHVIPCIDKWKKIDMRMRAFKVAPQEIVTIDRGILKIGADVQYRIIDPVAAHTLIQDIDQSLRLSAHAALNTNLCHEKIKYILNEKNYLQTTLQRHMSKVVGEWGIEVARFELTHSTVIKDAGGVDPSCNDDDGEMGGHAAIVNLLKSFTSPSSSTAQMPGMLPQNFIPSPMMQAPSTVGASTLLKPEELFCVVKGVINEDLCSKISCIYEFHVSNQTETKKWTLDLTNSPGCVINGAYNGIVDVKFKLREDCFCDIFYGKLSPTDAYMNGNLEIDGSLQSATRLEYLVRKMKGQ